MARNFGRYPAAALRADWLRAGAGLALTLFPFLLAHPHPLIAVPLLAAAFLFVLFAARTGQRQLTRVEVDEEGLMLHAPLGAAIRWREMQSVDLRYYSTRRDRTGGWMHLVVKGRTPAGKPRRIGLESTLDGFEAVAEMVARAAEANGLRLSAATQENFASLGFPVAEPPAQQERGTP
ncbi:hypothetical protein [Indioceanicola profundi]|uniref:hypothetical protein n=1 Tax=Indioceanicola profundi TaxID=2220096 RepID=UPI001CED1C34|nr:hypothetical protein [Indioceanicola profundi]